MVVGGELCLDSQIKCVRFGGGEDGMGGRVLVNEHAVLEVEAELSIMLIMFYRVSWGCALG